MLTRVLVSITMVAVAGDGRAQSEDGKIAGRCVDSAGNAVAKAKIELYLRDYREYRVSLVRATITAETGAFSLPEIPKVPLADFGYRFYYLIAHLDGHAVGFATLRSKDTPWTKLTVTLGKPTKLTGIVRDDQGVAVPNARVFVVGIGVLGESRNCLYLSEPNVLMRASSNAKGEFTLSNIPAGETIAVRADSPLHAPGTLRTKARGELEFRLEPGGIITGRVVMTDGEPARQVLIGCQGARGSKTGFATARTDDDGRYQLASLHEGPHYIWARAAGWTMVAHDGFRAEANKTVAAPVLTLIKGGFITGRVIDGKTGKPVKTHAMADVGLYGPSRPRGGGIESARIQDDGTFRIRAAPGRNYIYFRSSSSKWTNGSGVYVDVESGKTIEVVFRTNRTPKPPTDRESR